MTKEQEAITRLLEKRGDIKDLLLIGNALNRLAEYEDILKEKRLTEDFNLNILNDNDDPELYDDMENLYEVYSKLGKLEKIYEDNSE